MKSVKCEKCGHIMVECETDTCEGMRCPNCGYEWVIARRHLIGFDETIYNVKIDCDFKPSKEQLKALSKILNANYLTVNEFLKEGNISFEGKAIEIEEKLKML